MRGTREAEEEVEVAELTPGTGGRESGVTGGIVGGGPGEEVVGALQCERLGATEVKREEKRVR